MASASKRARVTVTDRDHETDEESEVCVTAGVEKRGKALKKSAFQKCRDEYFQNWPFLKPCTKGEGMIYCKIRDRHFSIRHGGAYDCERHIATAVHKGNTKDVMPCKTIAVHFAQTQQSDAVKQADSIMNAEIGMSEMIAELNLPLSTADAMVQFFKNSFPDSKIAQGMQCGRSKTTAIVKHLAATAKLTSDRMRTGPFSISTDGSNDTDAKKFPIVVRTFNEETGQVCSELLAMPVCQGSASGENIFSLLHAAVMEARASWTNCIALGVDNASVMTGANKGVYHFVKEKHDNVFLAGCTWHIVHNAAKKAAEHLPNFDEVLLDVYHYFNKSSSHQDRFKGDQELCGLEEKRMSKHVFTRWQSITRYPCLLPPGAKKQQIMQQFNDYQCCDLSSCKKIRVDETWTAIGQQWDETGELAFKELSQVMLGILGVPHSSAHCERVFSYVRKNKTDQRSSLSNDILESLLVLKSRTGIFGQRNYSQEQLKAVKSAYKSSLTS